MREVIAIGETIDEAIEAGCRELGVERDALEVSTEVVEMPVAKGFFRKAKPARVRVMIEEPEAPAVVEAPKAEAAPAKEEKKPEPAPQKKAEPVEVKDEQPAAEKAPEVQAEPVADEEEEVPFEIAEDEKVAAAVEYLKTVFEAMEVTDVTFTAARKGEATIIHVVGDNVSVLIGRRGETMESLSYLASLVANRMGGNYMKLGLDVAGYRDKREKDLEDLARRIGQKVQRSGRCYAMEPMNPYERRILHSTISKMEGLRSESKGEGSDRRVVIYSTAPNARNDRPDHERRPRRDGERGGRREGGRGGKNFKGGRGGDRRGNRSNVPGREFANRPRTNEAPSAPVRTERINDAADFALFGKIEL